MTGAARRAIVAALLGAALLGAPLVAGAPGGASVAAVPAMPEAPLNSSIVVNGSAVAVIPVGILGDSENTFYQVLVGSDPAHLRLATPPGVASNGGLALAGSPSSIGVAFLTSADLAFSPLARSNDAGRSWDAGSLPVPIARRPDALALAKGTLVALAGGGTSEVLAAGDPFGESWRRLLDLPTLERSSSAGRCRPDALQGVGAGPTGGVVVAVSCTRAGAIPLFVRGEAGWRPLVSAPPAYAATAVLQTLRLMAAPGGSIALVLATNGSRHALYSLRIGPGSTTTWSAPLFVSSAFRIVASGESGAGGAFVLGVANGAMRAVELGPGSVQPTALPAPPAHVTDLVEAPGAPPVALVPGRTGIQILRLDAATGSWTSIGRLAVPISLGSSS
jgi:hypothetical protein